MALTEHLQRSISVRGVILATDADPRPNASGAGLIDLNGQADALVLDADGDTTISSPTGNQIDIEIAGADDFTFTANSFNVLAGSAIAFVGSGSVAGMRTSSTTAAAITGATALTLADSGGVFSVSQAAAYDIDLPSPTTGPGCRYLFYLTGPAANNVTITVLGGAATFVGTIVNDVTSVVAATGATLTFASGTAALGDTIEIISISTSLYLVRAVGAANGAITIA
jgi:hypothetical protein